MKMVDMKNMKLDPQFWSNFIELKQTRRAQRLFRRELESEDNIDIVITDEEIENLEELDY